MAIIHKMVDFFFNNLLQFWIGGLSLWISNWTVKLLKRKIKNDRDQDSRIEQLVTAQVVLTRHQLYDIFKDMADKDSIRLDEKQRLDELYESYHVLGGNGTVTDIYNQLKRKDVV